MQVATIHLVALVGTIPEFLIALRKSVSHRPLTIARVIRWIITPSNLSQKPFSLKVNHGTYFSYYWRTALHYQRAFKVWLESIGA